jgi:hypothetical protein
VAACPYNVGPVYPIMMYLPCTSIADGKIERIGCAMNASRNRVSLTYLYHV